LLHLEHDGLDLCCLVLEGEIKVAGMGIPQIGYFTDNSDKGELNFKKAFYRTGEFRDGLKFLGVG
jgi:hypothetical protein